MALDLKSSDCGYNSWPTRDQVKTLGKLLRHV